MNAISPAVRLPLRIMLKGYDADWIREDLKGRDAVPVIPPRKTRKEPVQTDDFIYALRNQIERAFNKLKCARRLATRYDKTASSYLGFIQIVSARLWARYFVNRS